MKSDAQENTYVSMISDYLGVKITVNYNGDKASIVKEEIKHDSEIGQRIYNTTDLEWENNKILIPDSLNYWYVPFDEKEPFILMPRTYLIVECVEFYVCRSSSCQWVNIGGGCQQCKCGDQTSNPCKAVISDRNSYNDSQILTGGGVILKASSIEVKRVYNVKVSTDLYKKIILYKKNNIAFIDQDEIESDTTIGRSIINATSVPWKSNFSFQPPQFNRYWFVPLDGSEPIIMREPLCYSCREDCSCPNGSCAFRNENGKKICSCPNASTTCCTTVRCPCGEGTNRVPGSGMIIEADIVIIN
jgi:hypothetical protein